ncbi:MAG: TadG family pilus assembly protein [Planctomycetota bacterium]|jgi:hypothetical protein
MFTIVAASVLIGFAALTIDVGMMYSIRAELQRTADAAALAGVQDLRAGDPWTTDLARHTVYDYVTRNPILDAQQAVFDPHQSVVFGRATVDEVEQRVDFAAGAPSPNAVQVTIGYQMDYMFAGVFGLHRKGIRASALAAATPPRTADVVALALPAPGFGPVDPGIADHNPGKSGPSEPADGNQFQPGEEVAVFIFGKGPRQPVHLSVDITDSSGVAEFNRLLATEESLGGASEPVDVSVGDQYYIWGQGTGNANFGEKLATRLEDYDPSNDTVVIPIVEMLEGSRNGDGRLDGKVRIADFMAVTLTEVREVEVPDPNDPDKTMTISALFGEVDEVQSGRGNGFGTTSGTYTLSSVVTGAPQLLR